MLQARIFQTYILAKEFHVQLHSTATKMICQLPVFGGGSCRAIKKKLNWVNSSEHLMLHIPF